MTLTNTGTFVARIFGGSDLSYQDVIVYINEEDENYCSVGIKLPLLVKPSALRDDVELALYEHTGKSLGDLTFKDNG